ncbi:MAG: DUF4007 family protein [Gammaproteobacteria bacterium]|nr:DUF4007 family protein [Gammaproteobacteria bacterium]MDE0273867.1 DUF4007 family protein [Gammaproteobacteria bacterium]
MKAAERASGGGGWNLLGGQARVFSGHESFACRYGWLPKLYEAVQQDKGLFANDEHAILALGLGRNMVKAIRFWGQVFGLLEVKRGVAKNTALAHRLLGVEGGLDPYLEDPGSLWRLHWIVTAHGGLGAWVTAFLELQDAQITRDRLIDVVRNRAVVAKGSVTRRTATAHVDMLLRTYDWARFDAATPGEDASGCPFQELHLIETAVVNGHTQISVKRGPKPQLDVGAFAFALSDYWQGVAPGSRSLSIRSLLVDRRSPGVVFRLDEGSLLVCLEELCELSGMQMRSDGTGGMDLVGNGQSKERLEWVAWPRS